MSVLQSPWNAFVAWRIASIRRAYRSVIDVRSEREGFAALVDEIRRGTDLLDEEGLARADDAVLRAAFLGPVPLAMLGFLRTRFPELTAAALARIAPLGFGFMVGELRWSGPNENTIPACAFRIHGGERLCQDVCKAGTERFCAEHAAPIRLRPSRDDMSCTWTWSAPSPSSRAT